MWDSDSTEEAGQRMEAAYAISEKAEFQIKPLKKASLWEWVVSKAPKEMKQLVMNREEMLIWYSRAPTKSSYHEVSRIIQWATYAAGFPLLW